MSDSPSRRTVNAHATPFLLYDMEGPVQPKMGLVDSDGTTFGPGDFVSYDAGTHHNSWTENGCVIAVFEWQRPDARTNGLWENHRANEQRRRKAAESPREPSVDTTPPRMRRPLGIVAIEIRGSES